MNPEELIKQYMIDRSVIYIKGSWSTYIGTCAEFLDHGLQCKTTF